MPARNGAQRRVPITPAQVVLIVSAIGFSWYGMMAVHEAGHVINAALSGGTVKRVVVPLLGFSRTDVSPNPHPLFVVWGGPLWGCILPLALWGLLVALRLPYAFLARFYAGFCLLVNGIYIGAGALWKVADAGVMVEHGSLALVLMAFGVVAIVLGGVLWNRLGGRFGLGPAGGHVDGRAAAVMAAAFGVVLALVALFG